MDRFDVQRASFLVTVDEIIRTSRRYDFLMTNDMIAAELTPDDLQAVMDFVGNGNFVQEALCSMIEQTDQDTCDMIAACLLNTTDEHLGRIVRRACLNYAASVVSHEASRLGGNTEGGRMVA